MDETAMLDRVKKRWTKCGAMAPFLIQLETEVQ